MADRLRFYLDQNVDLTIARALLGRGVDVTTAVDTGRCARSDESQLAMALREGRVVVTHDQDFLVLHSMRVPHAGIVYARMGTRTASQMVQFLKLAYDVLSPQEMKGHVEFA